MLSLTVKQTIDLARREAGLELCQSGESCGGLPVGLGERLDQFPLGRAGRAVPTQEPSHGRAGRAAVGDVDTGAVRAERSKGVAPEYRGDPTALAAGFVGGPHGIHAGEADGALGPSLYCASEITASGAGHSRCGAARHAAVDAVGRLLVPERRFLATFYGAAAESATAR